MIDTDICIYAIGGLHSLRERLRNAAGELCMSSITFGELTYGAEKSSRTHENLATNEAFINLVPVASFDADAAVEYGRLRAELERSGTPCGSNDMLIGAHARSLGLTLVANNRREFDRMPGLKVENWV